MNDEDDDQHQQHHQLESKAVCSKEQDEIVRDAEGHQYSSSSSSNQQYTSDVGKDDDDDDEEEEEGEESSSIEDRVAKSKCCVSSTNRFQSDEDDADTNNDEDEELAIDDEDEAAEENHHHHHQVADKMSSSSSASELGARNAAKPQSSSSSKPKCLLNFKEILQMFNCSISQEQAWAILYELLNELKFLFEADFQFVNENKNKLDINSVYIEQEGSILLGLGEKDVNKIVDAHQRRIQKLTTLDADHHRHQHRPSFQIDDAKHRECELASSVSSTPPSPSPSPSPTPPPSKHSMMGRDVQQLKNEELEKILTDTFLDQEKQLVQKEILKSVAYLIFDALDYGNNYSNEPVLNGPLSRLLLLISGHYKEYKKDQTLLDTDEGDGIYSDDEDVDDDDELINFDKAIQMCKNNVAECDYHYRAVCRGLYAQAFELKVFLSKIEDSKKILEKSGKEPTHYCFEVLDKNDWAKLWMQVIHELRNVHVKLRKVAASSELSQSATQRRRHVEYELTPFEILLDQIRARKYSLKKVTLDQSLARELKKDARDIILDFIRSRPPLKKSSLRNLGNKQFNMKFKPINLHEQLMHSIRNNSTPLRKTSNLENLNKKKYMYKYKKQPSGNDLDDDASSCQDDQLVQSKKLLKPDKKLLLNNLLLSDDDDSDIDDDELNQLNELDMNENVSLEENSSFFLNLSLLNSSSMSTNATSSHGSGLRNLNSSQSAATINSLINLSNCSASTATNPQQTSSSSNSNKKRIKPAESLKTPLSPWCDGPIENWRSLINGDVLISNNY